MEKPLILTVDPQSPDAGAIEATAREITAGGIAVIPTDTVYGVGVARGDHSALERLRRIKSRPGDKPFALLLASADVAFGLASSIPPTAHRLMRRFWPGPLTIVLPSPLGGTVGMRVPGLGLTRDVISRSGGALAVSSANLSGGREPLTAQEALATLCFAPDVVLDAGPCRIGTPSTVVRVDRGGYAVLREGAIPSADIAEQAYVQVLFVCTGNTCRSPMAEGLMKAAIAGRIGVDVSDLDAHGFRVLSAGTSAAPGWAASAEALEAMREIGAEIGMHRSAPVDATRVDESDFVFVMTGRHRDVIIEMCGADPDRVMLVDPSGSGVSDPIGGGIGTYRRTRDTLEKAVSMRLDDVLSAADRSIRGS